jgi:hypothetical protein|tara:strand:- start:474 stop:695 length:222 start_codon:yes stop_codon:yes gene_type:complete
MKFEATKDKKETLFQGFYILFAAPTAKHQDEVSQMLCLMLMDSEITQLDAQNACERAIQAHLNEKQLEKSFNG